MEWITRKLRDMNSLQGILQANDNKEVGLWRKPLVINTLI
jgi:hypothetical protein